MIEEQGRVVAVDGSEVWIETIRQSACGSCSAKSTCGQGIAANYTSGKRNHIRLISDQTVATGDQVILGLPENTLIKSALMLYGLPLFLFLAISVVASSVFAASELWVILAGLSGLFLGFLLVRLIVGNGSNGSAFHPVILKVLPGTESDYEAARV